MLLQLLLAASAASASANAPPPAVLTPYIVAGHFDPGDYGWYRGALSGAAPDDIARWKEVQLWVVGCTSAGRARVVAELEALGVAVAKLDSGAYGEDLCGEVAHAAPSGATKVDWAQFQRALAQARPIAQAVIWSATLAQRAAEPGDGTLAEQLHARPMTDQVLRYATAWNDGAVKGAPELDPAARGIVQGMVWSAIRARDHANTAWLKAVLDKSGWSSIAQAGKGASHDAWLLVQHADDDPVFQYKVLRLIEPLAMRGDVSPSDYGYLYDRVMLKIRGRQRYGTQIHCSEGKWQPLALEDAARLDAYRQDAGMSTSTENVARIAKIYGPCRS